MTSDTSNSADCQRAQSAIAEAIVGGTPLDQPDVVSHLATCASCHAYSESSRQIWEALAELPLPQRPRTHVPAPQRRAWRPSMAAAVLLAVMLGYGAGAFWLPACSHERRAPPGAVTAATTPAPTDSSPSFVLFLDGGPSGREIPAAQMTRLVTEYSNWARGLRGRGYTIDGQKLRDDPAQWLGGPVTAGAGGTLGGYFVFHAHDFDDAQRIARTCPHLKYGGHIELRQIQPT